jgi:endonuclease YncB( thermonuclease family)
MKLAITLHFCSALVSVAYADIASIPAVVDGDTLKISDKRIRLHGIGSKETRQTCTKALHSTIL